MRRLASARKSVAGQRTDFARRHALCMPLTSLIHQLRAQADALPCLVPVGDEPPPLFDHLPSRVGRVRDGPANRCVPPRAPRWPRNASRVQVTGDRPRRFASAHSPEDLLHDFGWVRVRHELTALAGDLYAVAVRGLSRNPLPVFPLLLLGVPRTQGTWAGVTPSGDGRPAKRPELLPYED